MQHRLERAVEAVEALEEVGLVEIVGDLQAREVAHLVRLLQVVDRDDVGHARAVERLDDLRADEARGPGH